MFGLPDELPADLRNTKLVHILPHCAQKCISLMSISDKAQTANQWLCTVTNIVPFEAFSTILKGQTLHILQDLGLMDLAWRAAGE